MVSDESPDSADIPAFRVPLEVGLTILGSLLQAAGTQRIANLLSGDLFSARG